MSDGDNKVRKIGFWASTAIVGGIMALSGLADIANPPEVAEIFAGLGYPDYFPPFIGVLKLLGGVAIFAPKFPRLKEWAYAGICFDLLGASYSHLANGDGVSEWIKPVAFLTLALVSYFLRPPDRKLPDPS